MKRKMVLFAPLLLAGCADLGIGYDGYDSHLSYDTPVMQHCRKLAGMIDPKPPAVEGAITGALLGLASGLTGPITLQSVGAGALGGLIQGWIQGSNSRESVYASCVVQFSR